MKRIFLFVLTNVAVMAVLMVTSRILGVDRYLTANGLNMTALAGFSLIMGFGGATISLNPMPSDDGEAELFLLYMPGERVMVGLPD